MPDLNSLPPLPPGPARRPSTPLIDERPIVAGSPPRSRSPALVESPRPMSPNAGTAPQQSRSPARLSNGNGNADERSRSGSGSTVSVPETATPPNPFQDVEEAGFGRPNEAVDRAAGNTQDLNRRIAVAEQAIRDGLQAEATEALARVSVANDNAHTNGLIGQDTWIANLTWIAERHRAARPRPAEAPERQPARQPARPPNRPLDP